MTLLPAVARRDGDVRRTFRGVGVVGDGDGEQGFPLGSLRSGDCYPFACVLVHGSAPCNPFARGIHLYVLRLGVFSGEGKRGRVHRQRIDLRIFGALLDDGDASVFYPVVVLRLEGNGGGSLFRFGVVGDGDRQLFVGQPFDCHPLLSAFCERVCPLHADGRYGNRLWGGILRCEGERCGGYFERSGCCFRFSGLACGCQYACRCDEQYLFHHSFVF